MFGDWESGVCWDFVMRMGGFSFGVSRYYLFLDRFFVDMLGGWNSNCANRLSRWEKSLCKVGVPTFLITSVELLNPFSLGSISGSDSLLSWWRYRRHFLNATTASSIVLNPVSFLELKMEYC